MLNIAIPGRGQYEISALVLDFNGTIAVDGKVLPEIVPLLQELAELLQIFVLTADTFGTVEAECAHLPVKVQRLTSADHTFEKGEFILHLGSEQVIAIGNGANDLRMLKLAQLSIAVLGEEGCAGELLQAADVVVRNIVDGLLLILQQKRLLATLRR